MTSACIFKDTLRIDTQVFLKFRDSNFEICLHLINSNCTSYFLPSSMLSSGAGTSKEIPLHENGLTLPAILITLSFSFFEFSYSIENFIQSRLLKSICHRTLQSIRRILMCSLWNSYPMSPVCSRTTLQTSLNPQKNRTPTRHGCPPFLRSQPPKPQILTIRNNSIEPTMPEGFGRQLPIVPLSLNDLNLLPNPFTNLETMAVVNHTEDGNNDNYSPQSPEPSDPSPISTPPINVSTFNSSETPHTSTDDNTFYSEDEPRRVYWTSPLDETFYSEGEPRRIYLLSSPSTQSPPRKTKRKLEKRMSFPKRGGVSKHVCETC